ncbi:ABC transporter ATP-binding protein [Elizabethkingia anophelis]|uniref:ABC transporter ATP-binding protein n=1 Tax=Elizabethkingia anophelis TaxID=1117645 RepID=UPI002012252A|nr:ABC transporter ATP-binding protein [Elizabethkingia anophelis]MCL1682637.1 ABC transporter ATP-binding protein [Elizabethkingia anophelis]
MKDIALEVENLSKQYRLGQVGTGTLSHDLNRWWHKIRGKEDPYLKIGEVNDRTKSGDSDYVWALQDVNFKIEQGDAVGIIGRNGAGKSTLLKLLSKVTKPTTGNIKVKGRIASLLEVGTGFHPEMTGRENIFLNGAILGMTRREITSKFDEIVDFAGVERYVDTPVKRYSSGMYVRLAFAVAAHLESEILIVDEVLAVGDAEFQKKCLGKMGDVSKGQGRTVLFVSHNMASVQSLCNKGILMEQGTLKYNGDIEKCIENYLKSEKESDFIINDFSNYKYLDSEFFMPIEFSLLSEIHKPILGFVKNDENILVKIIFEAKALDPKLTFGIAVYNMTDELLFWSFNRDNAFAFWPKVQIGINEVFIEIPKRVLNEGDYKLRLMASIHYKYWIIEPTEKAPAIILSIKGGLSDSEFWIEKRPGLIAPVLNFFKKKD